MVAEAQRAIASPDDGKRFATLAARYALAGHGLIRTYPTDKGAPYIAMRWGFLRPLASLDAVEEFLNLIGGQA
ncbi:hypothetical protein [Ottowia sp.]|uniref:hypothetical protein n=1 Tax=Ottowia sp. TaxID=1898956 RepID=UPI0039E65896